LFSSIHNGVDCRCRFAVVLLEPVGVNPQGDVGLGYAERPPFSFANSEAAALDVDSHIDLRHWLQQIYREFRELDQRILLTDLKSDAARVVTKR